MIKEHDIKHFHNLNKNDQQLSDKFCFSIDSKVVLSLTVSTLAITGIYWLNKKYGFDFNKLKKDLNLRLGIIKFNKEDEFIEIDKIPYPKNNI